MPFGEHGPRVVHQYIQTLVASQKLPRQLADLILRGKICLKEFDRRVTGLGLDFAGCSSAFFGIDIDGDNRCALLRKRPGGDGPDARAAPVTMQIFPFIRWVFSAMIIRSSMRGWYHHFNHFPWVAKYPGQ